MKTNDSVGPKEFMEEEPANGAKKRGRKAADKDAAKTEKEIFL